MSKLADLHMHTHFSDGTDSPEEVVKQASLCDLNCIAITDHDTVDGIRPAINAAQVYGIEIISGIELSSEFQGKDVHILGYFFDYEDEYFLDQLNQMQDVRLKRMEAMIEKLRGLGINNIEFEEVCALAESKAVGRPHLAQILYEKGWVSNLRQAFDKYLADDAPAYVPKFEQTPKQAINLIKKAGGVAVLAHPALTKVDQMIAGFVRDGMEGIEIYYPYSSENTVRFYEGLAEKYGLVATGGSDAHGDAKKHTWVGKIKVDYEIVENLRARAECQQLNT